MSQILSLYEKSPAFPASDQHPDAVRYPVDVGIFRFADCIGGAPSQAELDSHLGLDAAGLAKADRISADIAEAAAAKIDAQIQSDLDMAPQNVSDTVDAIFASWTAPQRAFMKRLVRMVLSPARKVLR